MRAAIRSAFGSGKVLTIKEVETPTPKENEVLIKVYAASVNRTDCHILTGLPLFMRLFVGVFNPKLRTTGTDFAGQIEATGNLVKSFKVEDRVIGFAFIGLKSHAQYMTFPETGDIVTIPDTITYEQAAACVEGAFYALNGIKAIKPSAGQKALVIGATGAIGSSFVQFFKFYGTSVTAVCRGEHRDLVLSLGADKVIDYETEDFTIQSEKFDFVFDAVGKSSFSICKPLLKENGIFSSSGGLENLFLAFSTSLTGGKKVMFGSPPKDAKGCLSFIMDLFEKGNFKPVIDRKYPLEKIGEAFDYVLTGQKVGNVILILDS